MGTPAMKMMDVKQIVKIMSLHDPRWGMENPNVYLGPKTTADYR